MKTKDGQELDVVGQVNMRGKQFFIVSLPHPSYVTVKSPEIRKMTSFILMPFSDFEINNGDPAVELV